MICVAVPEEVDAVDGLFPEYRIQTNERNNKRNNEKIGSWTWESVYLPVGCDEDGKIIYNRTAIQIKVDDKGE